MDAGAISQKLHRRSVVSTGGCFIWQGFCTSRGYGEVRFEGKIWRVHRLAYEALVGPIPDGLEIDHLCRNRACWNPQHLEAVTHAVNMQRAAGLNPSWTQKHALCRRGHELTPENVYVRANGQRWCRTCQRLRDAERTSKRPSGWERQRLRDPAASSEDRAM